MQVCLPIRHSLNEPVPSDSCKDVTLPCDSVRILPVPNKCRYFFVCEGDKVDKCKRSSRSSGYTNSRGYILTLGVTH